MTMTMMMMMTMTMTMVMMMMMMMMMMPMRSRGCSTQCQSVEDKVGTAVLQQLRSGMATVENKINTVEQALQELLARRAGDHPYETLQVVFDKLVATCFRLLLQYQTSLSRTILGQCPLGCQCYTVPRSASCVPGPRGFTC
eukprot:2548272-Amphidinium_carterae.1